MTTIDEILAKNKFIEKLTDAGLTKEEIEREYRKLVEKFVAYSLKFGYESLTPEERKNIMGDLDPNTPDQLKIFGTKLNNYLKANPQKYKVEEIAVKSAK